MFEKKSKHYPYSKSKSAINSNKTQFYINPMNFPIIHAGIMVFNKLTLKLASVQNPF